MYWKRVFSENTVALMYGRPCFFCVIPTYEPIPWFMICIPGPYAGIPKGGLHQQILKTKSIIYGFFIPSTTV